VTSERDFYAAMDAEPDNIDVRGIFADWLEERNDPTAAGWRALWVGGYRAWWFSGSKNWGFWISEGKIPRYRNISAACIIPDDWFRLVVESRHARVNDLSDILHTPEKNPRYGPRVLLKVLAVAFTKLPPERQAELLRPVPNTVNA
jgi:uncharacterized protein (TIGR02996 family)